MPIDSEDPFSHIRAINRPHAPDAETSDFIHEAYLLLRRAPLTFGAWARQGAMESVAEHAFSWRVVGISEAALRHLVKTGTSDGLQRGHWFERKDRYARLFAAGSAQMSQADLIKFFYEHDTTIVVLKEQNNGKQNVRRWGKIIPVPDGHFLTAGYKFTVRKGTEVPWARKLAAELGLSE